MTVRSLPIRASEWYRRWRDAADAELRRKLGVRLVVIFWLLLTVAVSVRTCVRPSSHTVFPIFASSGDHWWSDQSLYELYPQLDRFRYPPVFALFVTPFSVLGLTLGGILWCWAGIAVYLAGLWAFVRDVIPHSWNRQRLVSFFLLAGVGALRGLWNAQSNALVIGLLLLGAAAVARATVQGASSSSRNRQWWSAAALLALAVCLKLTPLAPVLLLVALWPRQLAGRLIVVVSGLFLFPFLTRPPDIVFGHYREWLDHLTESENVRWIGFRDGWTVWLVARHLFHFNSAGFSLCDPMDSVAYRCVQIASSLGVLVWSLGQKRRAARNGLGTRWLVHVVLSMGLAWLMLFGPAVEHATYVFLAPSLIGAALERDAWPRGRVFIWGAFVLIMVLGWGAVVRLFSPQRPVLLTALPVGTVLFVLWLLGYARSCGRHNAPDDSRNSSPRAEAFWSARLATRQTRTYQS